MNRTNTFAPGNKSFAFLSDDSFDASRRRFKMMFTAAAAFIALTFIAIIGFMVFFGVNLASGNGYSYESTYRLGDYEVTQTQTFNR